VVEASERRKTVSTILRSLGETALWVLAAPLIGNYIQAFTAEVAWILAVVLVNALVLTGRLRGKPISVPRYVIFVGAFVPLLLWPILLAGELRLIHPYLPFATAGLGLAVAVLHHSQKLYGVVITAMIAATFLFFQLHGKFLIASGVLAFAILLASGGLLFNRRLYRVPGVVVAMAMMSLVAGMSLSGFYSINGDRLSDLDLDRGVRSLFRFESGDPVAEAIGPQIMAIEQACGKDTYFVASQMGSTGLVRFELADREVKTAEALHESANDLLVDCERNEMIAGSFDNPGELLFFNPKQFPEQARPPIPVGKPVVYIVRLEKQRAILALDEQRGLFAFDENNGALLAEMKGPDEWAVDKRTGEITALTEPGFQLMRMKFERTDQGGAFRVLAQRPLGVPFYRRLQVYMIPGPEAGTVLVSDLWTGAISLFDRGLNRVREEKIAPGISGMLLMPNKRHLAVGGYTDGFLRMVDMTDWSVSEKFFLGRRMRELRLSPDGRFLLVGTSQGGFRVDVSHYLEPGQM
jgi:hypothetical protein